MGFCIFGTHKSGHLCMCGVGVGICIVCHCVCVVLGLGHAKVGFCVFGTHNTVADAISRLEYNPKLNSTNEYNHATQGVSTKDLAHHRWSTFSKHWLGYNETNSLSNTDRVHLNQVFANRSEDDEIYPLTVSETKAML